MENKSRIVRKEKIVVGGIVSECTIVNDMPDFSKDPAFLKQLADMKAFLVKHPLPDMTEEQINQLKKDLEQDGYWPAA